jgi:predicted PurR-regulated permease PerM
MSLTRAGIFWITVLAAIIVIVVLLRGVLLPFVAGIALAYVLDPLANRLERLGLNRLMATLIILGLFIVGTVVVIFLTAPFLVGELVAFFENSPAYVRRLQVLTSDPARPWLRKLIGEGLAHAEQSLGELDTLAATWLSSAVRSIWSGGQALIWILSLSIVTPIVAGYVLYDWHRMVAAIDGWIPPAHRDTVRGLSREVDDAIGGFIRGQSAICIILSLAYALALTLIGLNHGLLIGLVAGIISFVPYLGAITALVVSMCVAIAQFWPTWIPILLVAATFVFGELFADYLLSPYLVGRSVNLHPVWLMFALFTFGYLFGFLGLLVAVPLAGAAGVLMRFALRRYLASSLYAASSGEGGMPPTDPSSISAGRPH